MTPDIVTLSLTSPEIEHLWRHVNTKRSQVQMAIIEAQEFLDRPGWSAEEERNNTVRHLRALREEMQILNMLHSKLERASRAFRTA